MKKYFRVIGRSICFALFVAPAMTFSAQEEIACRAVLLKVGDKYWRNYKCGTCGTIASSRPNVHGRQQCPTCGQPHTKEEWIDLPTEEVHEGRNSRIKLFVPEALIQAGEAGAELAGTGAKVKCPFCGTSSFNTQHTCGGCGATLTEERRKVTVDIPDVSGDSRSEAVSSGIANLNRDIPETEVQAQQPPPTISVGELRRNKRIDAIVKFGSAGLGLLTGSVILWNISRTPYVSSGQAIAVDGNQVVVRYTDRRGQSRELTVYTRPEMKVQVGESVDIHYRRWYAPRGGETSSGVLLTTQKPKK